MTTAQTVGTAYDARIRRAERLSSEYSFASEFLNFYKHIAAFQKTFRANIASSSGTKSSSTPIAELRAPLDLTVLLPHFRAFLSTIEQHAPPALAQAAQQLSLLPSDSWIASLEAYWKHAGKFDQQIGAFAQFLARAFLQPYAEFRAAMTPKPPIVATAENASCSVPFAPRNGSSGESSAPHAAKKRKANCRSTLPSSCPTSASKPATPASFSSPAWTSPKTVTPSPWLMTSPPSPSPSGRTNTAILGCSRTSLGLEATIHLHRTGLQCSSVFAAWRLQCLFACASCPC